MKPILTSAVLFAGMLALMGSGCSRCSRPLTGDQTASDGGSGAVPAPTASSVSDVSAEGSAVGAGGVPPGNAPAAVPVGAPVMPPADGSAMVPAHAPEGGRMPPGSGENPAAVPQAKFPMGSAVLETTEQVRARGKVPMGEPPAPMGFSPEERKRHEEMMARGKTPLQVPVGAPAPLPIPSSNGPIQPSPSDARR